MRILEKEKGRGMIILTHCHKEDSPGTMKENISEYDLADKYNQKIMQYYKEDYKDKFDLMYMYESMGLNQKIRLINNMQNVIGVIEIHFNSFPTGKNKGMQAIIRDKQSIQLAHHLLSGIIAYSTALTDYLTDLGINIEDLGQRWWHTKKRYKHYQDIQIKTKLLTLSKSIILELGYMTNKHDFELMQNPAWISCVALGILDGIDSYLQAGVS